MPELSPEVPARPAATVLLLRDTHRGLEVHLQKRRAEMDFGALAFVFPGGSVDAGDADDETIALLDGDLAGAARRMELDADAESLRRAAALHVCAVRECFEEAAVLLAHPAGALDAEAMAAARDRVLALNDLAVELRALGVRLRLADLAHVARFITPIGLPRRYDTYFFATRMPPGQEIAVHAGEASAGGWYGAADVLARADAGEVTLMPPTRLMLAELARHHSVASTLADLGSRPVCGILFTLAQAVSPLPDHLPTVAEVEAIGARLREPAP